jgi:hypothetical protein
VQSLCFHIVQSLSHTHENPPFFLFPLSHAHI